MNNTISFQGQSYPMNKIFLKIFLFEFSALSWTHCGPPDRQDYTIKPTSFPDLSVVKSCHTKFSEQGTSSDGNSDLKSISKLYNDIYYSGEELNSDTYKVSDLLESLHQDLAIDRLVCQAGNSHEFLVLAKIPPETINKITRYLDDFYEKNNKGKIPNYNNKSVPKYDLVAPSLFDSNVWKEIKNLQDDGIDIVFYTRKLKDNFGQFDPRPGRSSKPKLAIYPLTFSSIFYHEKFHYVQNKKNPIKSESSINFANFILEEFLARLKELRQRKDIFSAFIDVKDNIDKINDIKTSLRPIIPKYLGAPDSFKMGKVYTEKFNLTNTDDEIFEGFNTLLGDISKKYKESFQKISRTSQNDLKNENYAHTKLIVNDLCGKNVDNAQSLLKQKLSLSQIDELSNHSYAWGRSKTDICSDEISN